MVSVGLLFVGDAVFSLVEIWETVSSFATRVACHSRAHFEYAEVDRLGWGHAKVVHTFLFPGCPFAMQRGLVQKRPPVRPYPPPLGLLTNVTIRDVGHTHAFGCSTFHVLCTHVVQLRGSLHSVSKYACPGCRRLSGGSVSPTHPTGSTGTLSVISGGFALFPLLR